MVGFDQNIAEITKRKLFVCHTHFFFLFNGYSCFDENSFILMGIHFLNFYYRDPFNFQNNHDVSVFEQ